MLELLEAFARDLDEQFFAVVQPGENKGVDVRDRWSEMLRWKKQVLQRCSM